MQSHFSYFLSLAFGDYIFVTLFVALFSVLMFYFSFKIIGKYCVLPSRKIIFNAVTLVIIIVSIIIAARGGLQERILSIGDAYKAGRVSGDLKLNGVFTSLISIRSRTDGNKINISYGDALKTVRENLIDANEEVFPDENYPLMRQRVKFNVNAKNYNVVFILLESWQKEYIDSLSGSNYGVTPNFDELAKEAIVYDRFYANGQRSIMGLMSVFFSFPYVKGLTYMGYGLENYGQTKLPLILEANGYDNIYVQGDKRESDNAIALAHYLGFKAAYGKQDIPVRHDYLSISKGYDLEGFEFFAGKIKFLKKPFFAFYFTTTTHIPYAKTVLKSLEKYPEDDTEATGYLNRLYYSDYALGEFIKKSKREGWFDDTVFIMCSDHQAYGVGGMGGSFEKTKADKLFKIPMIIYCPALFKPVKTDVLGSQFDIVPTIMDMLNIEDPYSSLGKSLFSKDPGRFVFLSYEGEQTYLITNNGYAEQNWQNNSGSGNPDSENPETKLLFSTEKAVYDLITNNKWMK
jgi:phosphoglycerol transferase MdoB-like AlkP superfamily enzyme